MGADGTLLVNGRPFLLMAGQKLWLSLPSWGIPAQDRELWNRFGFY